MLKLFTSAAHGLRILLTDFGHIQENSDGTTLVGTQSGSVTVAEPFDVVAEGLGVSNEETGEPAGFADENGESVTISPGTVVKTINGAVVRDVKTLPAGTRVVLPDGRRIVTRGPQNFRGNQGGYDPRGSYNTQERIRDNQGNPVNTGQPYEAGVNRKDPGDPSNPNRNDQGYPGNNQENPNAPRRDAQGNPVNDRGERI